MENEGKVLVKWQHKTYSNESEMLFATTLNQQLSRDLLAFVKFKYS